MRIPVCEPVQVGNEKKYVQECMDTNWISSNGKFIEEFEKKFSNFCETKYGVSCSNGTTALHLALASLNIGEFDEVIVPAFSMIAIPNSVTYTGAKPVFVDSDEDTWNINPALIEKKITKKTKAIIVMHTYGNPCNMDKIMKIAKKHNLFVIEDCAQAHGATYKGKKVGSFGDVACFSFYGNKIITTGEGGMIVTNVKRLADKAKYLRNQAFGEPRFIHDAIGFNYRMTNIQAAIGLAQTEKANLLVNSRIINGEIYNNELKDIEGIIFPETTKKAKNVYWMYGIIIDPNHFGVTRCELMDKLKEAGIDTRAFFYPAPYQPAYEYLKIEEQFPVATYLYANGLYLPSSSNLSIETIKIISEIIRIIHNEAMK